MPFFFPPHGKGPGITCVHKHKTPTGDTNTVHKSYYSGLPPGTFYPSAQPKTLKIASGSFTFEYREYTLF